MPLTALDPVCALVVVDLQKGVTARPTVHPSEDVVDASARLAAAFRDHGLPVVLVTATGRPPGRTDEQQTQRSRPALSAEATELVDALPLREGDVRITKQRWGAFTGTDLHERLLALGVTQVLVTGIATRFGVESTARSAHELGYHVVLVTDAMTDTDLDGHRHSVEGVLPRLGETTTTAELLAALAGRQSG